ncbi:polysaccharide pyruvyl transferase family protein [Robertmurraya sp. GLU-23]
MDTEVVNEFASCMNRLKDNLGVITEVIPRGSKIYFFDYPVHNNVGDLLIWAGTEKFFKENDIRVLKRYSYHMVEFLIKQNDKFLDIPTEIILVCHGGGNFGDLYPIHQDLRKLLVQSFPNNRIVFLPQTIFFHNKKSMLIDFSIFRRHQDLHVFIRDKESYDIARKYVKNVYLCQDMAHALYPIKVKESKKYNTLYLLRKDKEEKDYMINNNYEHKHDFDWHQLYNNIDVRILRLFRRVHKSYKFQKFIPPNLLAKLWYVHSLYIIRKAIRLYSKYQIVVTSRLHGHILSCLMEKNNQILDNSYGKNRKYYESWTKGLIKVEFKDDPNS